MATLTLDDAQCSLLEGAAAAPAPAPPEGAGPGTATRAAQPRTLDDLVAGSWSSLLVSRSAACLLCGGDVTPRYGSGPHPVGGTCRSCGTEIA